MGSSFPGRRWLRLRGESLGGTQTRAPGSWVGGDLGLARCDRGTSDETESWIPAADADRQLGWADASPALGLEEPLDDAVLERVVAQDDEATAGSKKAKRGSEACREG